MIKWSRDYEIKYLLIASLFIFFGLLSKESAIVFIVLTPIILIYQTRPTLSLNIGKGAVQYAVSIFIVLSVYFLMRNNATTGAKPVLSIENNYTLAFSGLDIIYFKLFILLEYLSKVLFPINLSWDYSLGYFAKKSYLIEAIISIAILAAMIAYTISGYKQREKAGLFFIWYLANVLLISNLFFLIGSTMADRLMYLPLIGLISGLVLLIYKLIKKYKISIYYAFGLLALSQVVYIPITYNRIAAWKSDDTLMANDYQNNKKSFRVEVGMVNYYLHKASKTNNLSQEDYQKCKNIVTGMVNNYNTETVFDSGFALYEQTSNYAEGVELLKIGIKKFPKSYKMNLNLGVLYHKQKDFANAEKYYLQAIKYNDKNDLAYSNLGMVYHEGGKLLLAKKYYEASLVLNPKKPCRFHPLKVPLQTWRNIYW